MSITTLTQLNTALSGTHQEIPFYFSSAASTSGAFYNLNRLGGAGGPWGQGAAAFSSTGYQSDATAGYPALTGAAGQSLYLARATLCLTVAGVVTIFDRVWAQGAFNAQYTDVQPVTATAALPSNRAPGNGEQLEIWVESQGTTGGSGVPITVKYVNSAGVSDRTTVSVTVPASLAGGRMLRLPLQDGDTGVSEVSSVTISSLSGSAGNIVITLLKRKCIIIPPALGVFNSLDFATLGMPIIEPDACLEFQFYATNTTSGNILGTLSLVAG
jgi:hypothetical protein